MDDTMKYSEMPNSSDSIYRQAAIDALADMHCKSDEDGYVWIIRSDAWARIDALPSVTPKRKTGKWIPHSEKYCEYIGTVLAYVEHDYWFCDTCGYRVEKGQPMYNFCPNCGARMI